jgi:hypothetical protein
MSNEEDSFKSASPAANAEGEAALADAAAPAASGEAASSASAGDSRAEEEWIDGTPYDPNKPGPFDDDRLPEEEGPPYPGGLADPLSPDLIDGARYLLRFIRHSFWDSPKWMAWVGSVWQWRKFDFLDWLRPLELLLRRLIMIEALSILASQALPQRTLKAGPKAGPKAGKEAAEAPPQDRTPKPAPVFDYRTSERWKVSFQVMPRGLRRGPRRRYPLNPEIARFHYERYRLDFERISSRYRRVLHPMLPLAKRLEAVIRVVTNPAPFARRTAFRLRARASLNADWLLVDPMKPRRPLATDALRMARDRIRELYGPVFELHWSSA